MIYVYAITEPGGVPPICRGLQEAPVELIERGGIAAAYSVHAHLECRTEPTMLWRHELVVERLMDRAPILPARFATTFPELEALAAALDGVAPRLREQLERVRGCVELAVRVRSPSEATPAARDGRNYLNAKLLNQRERESVAERTLIPLRRLAADSRHHELARDGGVISASYLVPGPDVSRFADEVRTLQRENQELSLSCTGPWAPYSFAEVQT